MAVDRLVDWAESWQVKISITKCNYMIIGKQSPFNIDVKIGDLCLPHVTSCRDLGIQVCSSLSNSSHIANVVNVASQRCNLIMRSFITRDTNILERAFITYVKPLLEYNSVIWSPQTITDIRSLEKVQRQFTKRLPCLSGMPYNQHVDTLGLQTLELRRLIMDLVYCYKIVFGLTCLDMNDFLKFSPTQATRGHPYKLFVPFTSRYCTQHFFLCV